jgi:GH24 family phage-related lysozyme (muramidase)
MGALLGIAATIGTIGTTIAAAVTGALSSIPTLLTSIFSAANIGKMFGIGLDVMKGLGSVFRMLLPIITNPLFIGLAAGLIGAKWLMDLIDKGNDEANTEEKKKGRVARDEGSNSSKLAARTIRIDAGMEQLLGPDGTDDLVSAYTRGEFKTKKELSEAVAAAKAQGKNAVEVKDSRVAKEMQEELHGEALQSMNDGSYANAESKRLSAKPTSPTRSWPASAGAWRGQRSGDSASPTKVSPGEGGVSEELVNYIKKKEKFSARAFKDHKQISIGYGTKANSEDEVITEAEADARLRKYLEKAQKDVVSYGKNKGYDWNQKQIDALTSFVYNLGPGALRQVTADGKRSNQEIAAKIPEYNQASGKAVPGLVTRRNEELAMFSMPSPTTGTALASGSTAASDMKMALLTQQQSAPVVINQQSAAPQKQSAPSTAVASAYNLDPWMDLFGTSILNPGGLGA